MTILWPVVTYADLQDPTQPPDINQAGSMVLTAVIISPGHSLAVINGKIVHLGEMINGMKVTSIKPNSVDLESPQEKETLVLIATAVKNANN
jgi:hypothetical protein